MSNKSSQEDFVLAMESLKVKENFNTNNKNEKKEKKGEKVYEIEMKAIKQSGSWDCGIACVKMVLEAYGIDYSNIPFICQALELNTSIWTIDLCYILHFFNISHTLCTKTTGVDESYANEPFYKEYFDNDSTRVNRLFREAAGEGLQCEKRSVFLHEIGQHLKTFRPVIILVNWSLIKPFPFTSCFKPFFFSKSKYQGHFIVLTGCSEDLSKFIYLNPEKATRKSMSSSVLEAARKSYGTDEDIIFITQSLPSLHQPPDHGDA